MFSANENLMLRQHKRRIIEYVEECIPEDALDMGTTVMVMQVSCKAPGCVPLETLVCIVFPRSSNELVPGIPESKNGGTYKTKILKPMTDVIKEDVLESLPPQFIGGLRTIEKLCLRARDVMLSQITQIMGDSDTNQSESTSDSSSVIEDKKLMAEYLINCLHEYINNNCVQPEWGEPFPPPTSDNSDDDAGGNHNDEKDETNGDNNGNGNNKNNDGSEDDKDHGGNKYNQQIDDTDGKETKESTTNNSDSSKTYQNGNDTEGSSSSVHIIGNTNGNFVIRRRNDCVNDKDKNENIKSTPSNTLSSSIAKKAFPSTIKTATISSSKSTSNDWRRQQNMEKQINQKLNINNNTDIIAKLTEREHEPGVRRPGCPCCDPDNPANYVDNMMML